MNAEDYTDTQATILARIIAAGYTVKSLSMIGRKLWLNASKNRGNVFLDECLCGTIGVRGKLALKYEQWTYRQDVTEDYQLANRLE